MSPAGQSGGQAGALAVVLAGGGARGAYELGVLRHVLGELVPRLGPEAIPRILSGTSVGAINACCVGALAAAPGMGIEMLCERWEQLRIGDIFKLGWGDLTGLFKWVIGKGKADGPQSLLDPAPLADLVRELLPWRALHENVKTGLLKGVSATATDVESGHAVVFLESEIATPRQTDPHMEWVSCRLTPRHALASAAIPIVFPTVRVAGRVYSDGSLRQNTPLAPALRMGAGRVLVISLRTDKQRPRPPRQDDEAQAEVSSPLFLLGKLMNGMLLDSVESDLLNLRRVNDALRMMQSETRKRLGDDALGDVMRVAGGGLREVKDLLIRPSVDLGKLAAEVASRPIVRGRLSGPAGFFLRQVGDTAQEHNEPSDVLSYLFLDGEYCHELIALGARDARAREEELAQFLMGE
ncbi:MAG: patatin-like phospholipase family protein [Deltaproteobacteria bacterium]|nr:patatin-like phospholipase family protein [Deltaproteobacteria bacterium]